MNVIALHISWRIMYLQFCHQCFSICDLWIWSFCLLTIMSFSRWRFSWMFGNSLRSVYMVDEDLIWTILLARVISSAQMELPVCPSVRGLVRKPCSCWLEGGREGRRADTWMGQAFFLRGQVALLLFMETSFLVSISVIEHCLLLLPRTNCYVCLSEFCHQGAAQTLIRRQRPSPEAQDYGTAWKLVGVSGLPPPRLSHRSLALLEFCWGTHLVAGSSLFHW